MIFANSGAVNTRISSDDSTAQPKDFGYARGVCSEMISFTDVAGNDVRHLWAE